MRTEPENTRGRNGHAASSLAALAFATWVFVALFLAPVTIWMGGAQEAVARQAPDTTWNTHTVRPGDTLFAISRQHNVTVQELRAWNAVAADDLKAGMTLRVGYELMPSTPEFTPPTPPVPTEPVPGDPAPDSTRLTLLDVVSSYGIRDSLDIWQAGASAWLGKTAVQRITAERPPRVHVVTAGETLFGVSRAYGVDSGRLREVNNMSGTGLRIGQELRIPGSDGSVTASGLGPLPPIHDIVSVLAWPSSFEGQLLQSGYNYDPADWLAGHPEWPIGAVLLVENPENGRMALARVADRTPGAELGVLDVSASVHEALQLEEASRVRVRLLPWSVTQ